VIEDQLVRKVSKALQARLVYKARKDQKVYKELREQQEAPDPKACQE